MPELTAEQLKEKEEKEKLSLQEKEKATLEISKSQQEDQVTKTGELTDAQKLRIYEIQQKTVREQGARLTAAEKELSELRVKEEEKAAPTMEESAKEFYSDPVGTMKKAMAEMVAPLNEFKDKFESNTEYSRIKRGLMTNPSYARHLENAQFSSIVDELIEEGSRTGMRIDSGTVEAAIKHTIGAIALGDIVMEKVESKNEEKKVVDESKENREDVFIPPYLQPSSPPFKEKVKGKQYRDLTENEARLARERGQTKEEYLEWLEVPATDVIDSKIGMKKEDK